MLKKNIEYKDFFGNDRKKTLYFHISTTEMLRMVMAESDVDTDALPEGMSAVDPQAAKYVKDGLSKRIKGVMTRGKGGEILELFDWLTAHAYGEIGDDGETFVQSKETFEAWTHTASYSYFFERLVTETDLMTEFVNGVFPEEMMAKAEALDPEFARHREALAKSKEK